MSIDLHKKIKKSKLYPILILERFFTHRWRHRIDNLISIAIFLVLLSLFIPHIPETFNLVNLDFFVFEQIKVIGVIFVLFSLWLSIYLLELFFRSLYFKEKEDLISLEVLNIFRKTKRNDMVGSFLLSKLGGEIMARCGLFKDNIEEFISERKEKDFIEEITFDDEDLFTLENLSLYLLKNNREFEDFLFKNNIREKQLLGSAKWIIREQELRKKDERWWSQENLERVPSIGVGLSEGIAYTLNKFGSVISGYGGAIDKLSTVKTKKVINNIESVLSREREANVMLVSEDGGGKIEVLQDFAKMVTLRTVVPQLEHKKVVLFDSEKFASNMKEKHEFEQTFLKLLNESINAGNIILVIDKFPDFIINARKLGVEILTLIDSYLVSNKIQIIALSDLDKYHQFLEQDPIVVRRFETIIMEQPSLEGVMIVLIDVVRDLESRHPIFFTYLSLETVIESVDRYFSEGIMPDKAIDIVIELVTILAQKKEYIVKREDVLSLVQAKTNIPVGEIQQEEREKLIKMEEILHKRVIGQEEAIKAVSNAVRRARADIQNTKRPIGSFLFVGSTGVGKTETAKALAEVFFKDEDAISRLDMSEYQGDDAIDKLIGSFDTGKVGLLSKILRENPYGVLLLDEIEKANKSVHDLFLQIIDEGIFTDMNGKKVNARNIILIGTSNAGSDLIWDMIQENVPYQDFKKDLINTIIERGIFKPEFLNRFDAIVTFQPLKDYELKQIAVLMLNKLSKRLKTKGINLVINDALVDYITEKGSDPKFGARPMNRVIQNNIEQKIAEMFISGKIKSGSDVEFKKEDFL